MENTTGSSLRRRKRAAPHPNAVAPSIAAASRRRPDDEDIAATAMPTGSIGDELLTGPGDGDGPCGVHVARAGAGWRSGRARRA